MLQPGHAPRYQRHPLGLRAVPLPGQGGAERHAAPGGAERAVRMRALRHPPPVLHDRPRGHPGQRRQGRDQYYAENWEE